MLKPRSLRADTKQTTGTPAPGAGEWHSPPCWVSVWSYCAPSIIGTIPAWVNIWYGQNRGTVSWPFQLHGAAQGPPNNRAITPPTKGRAWEGCAAEESAGRKVQWSYRAWPPAPSAVLNNLHHGREWAEIQAPPGPLWVHDAEKTALKPGCANGDSLRRRILFHDDVSATFLPCTLTRLCLFPLPLKPRIFDDSPPPKGCSVYAPQS